MAEAVYGGERRAMSTRMFDQLRLSPRSTPHTIWRLRNLMRETLLFRLDEYDPTPSHGYSDDHSAQLERLRHHVAARFFTDLYVHRPEADRLVEIAKASPCLTILSGPRGSGKSTIMLHAEHELRTHLGQEGPLRLGALPAQSVHYLNLKRFGSTIRWNDEVEDEPSYQRVFGVLYQSLINELLDDYDQSPEATEARRSFGREWRSYRLRNSPVHRPIWQEVRLRAIELGLDPVKMIDDDPELSRAVLDADRALIRNEAASLEVLLRFLAEEYGHHCIFLIDNVDRFSRSLHIALAERLQELTHSGVDLSVVLSVRTANLDGILDRPNRDATLVVVELPSEILQQAAERPDAPDGKGPAGGGPDGEGKSASIDGHLRFVSAVFEHRLSLLSDFVERDPEGLVYRDEVLIDELNAAGFSSLEGFLDLCRNTAEDLDPQDGTVWLPTHAMLLEWHNHSLRSALAQLFDVASCALTGQDPLLPRPRGLDTQLDVHDFRSLLWRHLIFGERRVPNAPQLLNVFIGDHASADPLWFQRLKVLQFLANAGAPRFREMVDFFGDLGIDQDSLDIHLRLLTASHGFESEGLTSIETRDLDTPIASDAAVWLRPAGRFFISRLVVSCEYLFWCAMGTPAAEWSQYPRRWSGEVITEDLVLDDGFRAEVAAEYLEHFLIPRAKAELQPSGFQYDELQLRHARLDRLGALGRDRTYFVPIAACRSLLGFIDHGDMHGSAKAELREHVTRLLQDSLRHIGDLGSIDLTNPRTKETGSRSTNIPRG